VTPAPIGVQTLHRNTAYGGQVAAAVVAPGVHPGSA